MTTRTLRLDLSAWAGKLGGPMLLSGAATAFTLLSSVIILRTIPVHEAGVYALLSAMPPVLALFGAMGQPTLTMRTYSQAEPHHHDWWRDLGTTLVFSLPFTALALMVVAAVYRLPLGQMLYVVVSLPLLVALVTLGSVLNAHRRYAWSNILIRLPNALMMLPAAAMLVWSGLADLALLLIVRLVVLALALGLALLLAFRGVRRGQARMPLRKRPQAWNLAVLNISAQLLDPGLQTIAGSVVTAEMLAAYAALAVFLRPVSLFQIISMQVLIVESARDKTLRWRRLWAIFWAAAVLVGAAIALLGPPVSRLVYAGRYDAYLMLALPIGLIATLSLTEALPRSFLIGRADRRSLSRFALLQLAISLLGIALIVWGSLRMGIVGTAWAGVALAVMKNGVAYILFALARRQGAWAAPPGQVEQTAQ